MPEPTVIARLKQRARDLKTEIYALSLAVRDPRTPWYARLLVTGIIAYALSPVDLIPDFIPVIGYLDDLILIPLGLAWAIKLIPHTVLMECRTKSSVSKPEYKRVNWTAGMVIIILWILLLLCLVWFVYSGWIAAKANM